MFWFQSVQALADCEQILGEEQNEHTGRASKEASEIGNSLKAAFKSSMADDLLTPVAVAALSEPLKYMNDLMHTRKVSQALPHFSKIFHFCRIVCINSSVGY